MTTKESQHSRAQIVATVGPASKDIEILKKMVGAQMDVARLNFSHGTHEEHAELIRHIRTAAEEVGRKVQIIQDLSGPREKIEESHRFKEGAVKIITEKDRSDLEFGLGQDVDYIALSYVGSHEDILELREIMKKRGKVKPIIAKIERQTAVDNIDKIIEATDAVMVARGDLSLAIPMEKVPFVQKEIIKKCKKAGKPVIVATQMLLSMVENIMPTIAEVSDVASAILAGADAVMLSEESAIGKYPVETIIMMEKIILEAEKHLKEPRKFNSLLGLIN